MPCNRFRIILFAAVVHAVSLPIVAITLPAHGNVATVAGTGTTGPASSNIQAMSATFNGPSGVAVDQAGDVFIADANNNVVREVVASTGIIKTVAGNGSSCTPQAVCGSGGQAISAQLNAPIGIAVDTSGNLYIADHGSQELRMVTAGGVISTLANGVEEITGVAVDNVGNVYYSDQFTNAVYKLNVASGTGEAIAGQFDRGYEGDGGPAVDAYLCSPQLIAVDSSGNVFISDAANNIIREISKATGNINTVVGTPPEIGQDPQPCGVGNAGTPVSGQPATSVKLSLPGGLSVDQQGNLFFVDNSEIYEDTASTGLVTLVAGGGSSTANNVPATSTAMNPSYLAFDSLGNLYYPDQTYQVVRVIGTLGQVVAAGPCVFPPKGYIATLAGTGAAGFSGDQGNAASAKLDYPQGVSAYNNQNMIFVGDTGNNRVRMVNLSNCQISTIAGNGTVGNSGDNGQATAAQLNQPIGVTVDSSKNVYIADSQNGSVRELTYSTNYASSVISSPVSDFELTNDVGFDINGNVDFSDPYENSAYSYNPSTGTISTIAGSFNRGYTGDGGAATAATLASPQGIGGYGPTSEGYIADEANSVVRMVNFNTGIISTVAGNGTAGYVSDGVLATSTPLGNPDGVAADNAGNLFIADTGNNRIREVNAMSGIITTVVGTGAAGFAGDGGPAENAEINAPAHIGFDPAGNLYIADSGNQRIRVVSGIGAVQTTPTITSISPTSGSVGTSVTITGTNFGATQGTSSVTIGGTKAAVSSWSGTNITVTVPTGAQTGSLIVTVAGIASNPVTFTVLSSAFTISPTSGPVGTAVTITGSGFGATQASSSSVSFNGTEVTAYTAWSATSIAVQVPAGATTGFVTVTIGGQTQTGPTFTVTGTSGGVIYSYSVPMSEGYDTAGNVKKYVDTVMGSWSFGYDALNRLGTGMETSAPTALGVTDRFNGDSLCIYYDSFGNRTQSALQQASCAAAAPAPATYTASNQVTSPSYSYDAAGNVTYDGVSYYAYDNEGRLCAMQSRSIMGGTLAYGFLYDAEGRRTAKGTIHASSTLPLPASMCNVQTNGFQATEGYLLDASGNELTTVTIASGSQNLTFGPTNVYANGGLLATYGVDQALHFQLADPLGTRRVQTNAAGSPELNCQSLPFGDQLQCSPSPVASSTDSTPLHFTGKHRDPDGNGNPDNGNDYFGARYYAQQTGRFISPDPTGLLYADPENPQSLNLYTYALNNPLLLVDPSGLTPCSFAPSNSGNNDQQSGTGANNQQDVPNDEACIAQGGTPIDYVTNVTVNADSSSTFSLFTYSGGSSTLIQNEHTPAPSNQILPCFVKGAGTGVLTGLAVAGGTALAATVLAPEAVTGALLAAGAYGGYQLSQSVKADLGSGNNAGLAYSAGAFLGGAAAGGATSFGVRASITGETAGPSGPFDFSGLGKLTNPFRAGSSIFGNIRASFAKGPDLLGGGAAIAGAGAGIPRKGC